MQLQSKHIFSGHSGPVYALEIKDHTHFFSAGSDGIIAEWSRDNPSEAKALAMTNQPVFSLCYLRDRQVLLAGTLAGWVHSIDLNQAKEVRISDLQNKGVFKIHAFDNKIWVLGGNGKLGIYNEEMTALKEMDLSESKLRSILCMDSEIWIGDSAGQIFIVSYPDLALKHVFRAHSPSVYAMVQKGEFIYSSGRDGHIRKWNKKMEMLWQIPAHNYAIYSLFIWGDKLVSGSRDRKLKMWNTDGDFLGKTYPEKPFRGSVNHAILWQDTVLCASDDARIQLFILDEQAEL